MPWRCVLWRGLLAVLGVAALSAADADRTPTPSDDLLEYLGKVEEADQAWSDFIEAATTERDAPKRAETASTATTKVDK